MVNITAASAMVALAISLAAAFLPQYAHAQSFDDLQGIIDKLLERVADLQRQLSDLRGSGNDDRGAADLCNADFARNLSVGDRGPDVRKLQRLLNSDPATRLAGDHGIFGNETGYYGPSTANAVARFQEKYASRVLAPAGLHNGSGFFGALTRSEANRRCDNARASAVGDIREIRVDVPEDDDDDARVVVTTQDGSTISFTIETGSRSDMLDAIGDELEDDRGLNLGEFDSERERDEALEDLVTWNEEGDDDDEFDFDFTVSPRSGDAPLTVAFSANAEPDTSASSYYIALGNGETVEMDGLSGICQVGAGGPCNDGSSPMLASYTYETGGTYTAALMKRFVCNATAGISCPALESEEVARVTVTVDEGDDEEEEEEDDDRDNEDVGDSNTTFRAIPRTGDAPLDVWFSAVATAGTAVSYGDGEEGTMSGVMGLCSVGLTNDYCDDGASLMSAWHTYDAPGTYTAVLMQPFKCNAPAGISCPALAAEEVARITITVTD